MNKIIKKLQLKWGLGNMQVFSYGNSKLPKETLIVNITSAHHCPSEILGLCKCADVCYAKKCERIYANYYRKNELIESFMNLWDDSDIKELLTYYIVHSPTKIKYVRLNEAGDFPNQSSVERWNNISNWLEKTFNIKTYCYTCRSDLDFSNVRFAVNASNQQMNAQRYFSCLDKVNYEKLPNNAVKCKGDCRKCSLCYASNYKGIIYVKQH